jgi:phenylalanyl-tRNA synthetase beta chain
MGPALPEQWSGKPREVDFADLKAVVEGLLGLAAADADFRPASDPWGHPGRSARIWRDGRDIGWIGHLHPALVKSLDLEGEVLAFELDVEPLAAREVPRASEISRFPSVRRDLALVVPEATPWSDLQACLERALAGRLQEVVLFDEYRGPGLETGTKSLAMGLILQEVSRTLTDSEADQAVADALAALARDCKARIRS